MPKTTKTSIEIDADLKREVRLNCLRLGITMKQLIDDMLRRWIADLERKGER